ncbi:MAG: hypothetical protein JGK17_31090 [Microcoleus sp. PH2017_10_PVI_O_A]|uniref:hypothetical protein n=1 Tax=unclassified Microcoleus TaxID=2642155 RepID=UPI001DAAFA6A|nr:MULTISPECIES: hypothetical protein [unclassified Microcoleus]MCC3409906.1 hypothetical protein [Microcoleus sp. PH2017_10_PVI_O_A]MCC3464162.1 hypothetical protein [Microcoleus sp. PH2017_11_PCY_U_A]MCC3482495.1 hypothetical protein [Microcoleus sp. PH2017_12_PCY_D_A]MCC3532294.1 hypothetical protein [Microcoleus sp. PH2017_21_RUC_O_A]MCC3544591.1 hypothetical protein [Microcoleus sp. PH2017_22_RUC_O_B]
MPRIFAKALLANPNSTLAELVDALVKLSQDKGYLQGKEGFSKTICETDSLIDALRDRILQIASK